MCQCIVRLSHSPHPGTEANEAVRMKLTATPEGLDVEVGFVGLPRPLGRQGAEFLMAVSVACSTRACWPRHPPDPGGVRACPQCRHAGIPRFFGCPVEFGRAVDEGAASDLLEFSNAAIAAPLVTADQKLLKALEPFCDLAAKERRTASDTLRAAVEKQAEKLLPHGKAQKQTVAKALGMSTRTLSRRLAVEETTYEEVVDQLRRSLALQYLKDPGMSLSQIAWQLGYEESTSFNHAFRRWTGRSPSEGPQGEVASCGCIRPDKGLQRNYPFASAPATSPLGFSSPLAGRDEAVEAAADCVQKRLVAERAADQRALRRSAAKAGSSASRVEKIGEARRAENFCDEGVA